MEEGAKNKECVFKELCRKYMALFDIKILMSYYIIVEKWCFSE